MIRRLILVMLLGAFCGLLQARNAHQSNFNDGWLFALGDNESASKTSYDDSSWRRLQLPHDWAIEGDFDKNNPSGTGGGALPGGIGWYRKHFAVDLHNPADRVYIDFDGVYMNASVYVNGHLLGTRPYGYVSFSYDITPYINADGDNVIAVKVDNSEQPNSRWYSGCGIYRNVWLRHLGPVHVPLWGQYVTANKGKRPAMVPAENGDNWWNVEVNTTVENTSDKPRNIKLISAIYPKNDLSKSRGANASRLIELAPGASHTFKQTIAVQNPRLWDIRDPQLYRVQSQILDFDTKESIDTVYSTFGFRTVEFDHENGFFLNGRNMKINGVCLHHDAGALGAVVNRRAIERQLMIMKEMGANAVRSSHNHPAPELLELCDSLGLMVMDEAFDMWRKKKTAHDYSRYFNEWHERDLADLVVRDRNHPSIIMWSIGNEVLEQWSHADADTLSLEQANLLLNFGHSADMLAAEGEMSVNSLLTIKLANAVRQLDPTRPVTSGCNEPNPGNHLFRSGALDIIGFNYHDDWFKDVPKNFPGKPFVITESVSALMTRGYYRMPSDSIYLWPERWDKPFFDDSFSCSSYDNCHAPWGNTHEGTMRHVENNKFIMGQFVWTGFDYLGEPTPFGWPARSSYFGIVDLAGFPKDVYYMYQSRWRPEKTVLHLFPHWNWQEGSEVDLWAYYNNADEVELFVNGKSQGVRRPDSTSYHASWRVTYTPGKVEAVSRKNGKEVARTEIRTASEPYRVRLTADRTVISPDGKDLCYLTAEIVDKDGNLCPTADNEIVFEVKGAGKNVGVDNGSPISLERFKSDKRRAFNGKALLIVQSNGEKGKINILAKSANLKSANETINAKL